MTSVLTRKEEEETQRYTGTRSHGVPDAEIGLCCHKRRNPKGCLQPPESRREAAMEQILPLNPQEGITPRFQISGLQNHAKIHVFVFFSHHVCGTL